MTGPKRLETNGKEPAVDDRIEGGENRHEGGRAALAGYLYQMVGTLGLQARALRASLSEDEDELQALLEMVGCGQLLHESRDQDAAAGMVGDDGVPRLTLVQFKYSSQPRIPSITEQQLREIVNRLVASTERARQAGFTVVGYVLVSNRHLNQDAQALVDAARAGELRPEGTTNQQWTTIAGLKVASSELLSSWRNDLAAFGHQYGATGDEIRTGTNRLVGDLLSRTQEGGDVKVDQSSLIEALTGCRTAMKLTADAVAPRSAEALEAPRRLLGMGGPPAPRAVLEELAKATALHAVVVVAGLGGSGKTVLAWHWAREMTNLEARREGAFTAFTFADRAAPAWVANTVSEWRGLPHEHPHRQQGEDVALARLLAANQGLSHPILHLGLDGVDEIRELSEARSLLVRLIDWCWKEEQAVRDSGRPPRMTLVVTCREEEYFTREFLRLDRAGMEYGIDDLKPITIHVGDFSRQELLRAASERAPNLYPRIQRALDVASSATSAELVDIADVRVLSSSPSTVPSANPEVVRALQSPVVWQAWLALPSLCQERALDGDPSAMQRVARTVVQRFLEKVGNRVASATFRQRTYVRYALHDIAKATLGKPADHPRQREHDWLRPARAAGDLSNADAAILFQEALSGGLIDQHGPRTWRWRHHMVRDYLARPEALEEGEEP